MKAERGASPSGRGVIDVLARRLADAIVHHTTALRAMAHGGVRAVMIEIVARRSAACLTTSDCSYRDRRWPRLLEYSAPALRLP
jgi:hypothetical protein